MNVDLAPEQLKRFKDICKLLWKYGRSDLVRQMGVDDPDLESKSTDERPEQLADDLEAMGPTYIKLGQVLASRPDIIPEAWTKPLERLQDNIKPFDFADVESIFISEIGVSLSKAFSFFDPVPVAAASLGQVHRAALRDGRPVVVKVQRPDIVRRIADDFVVLKKIARLLDKHTTVGKQYRFSSIIEELDFTLQQELDYEREARNMLTLGRNLAQFQRLRIPQPVPDYSRRRILTMDYIEGRKITSVSPLAMLELDGAALAEDLHHAYLQQVLVDGIFHADPHPGNVFITQDGQLALLDLGMVGHTTPEMQEHLLKILLAVSEGKSEEATAVAIRISETAEHFDKTAYQRDMSKLLAQYQEHDRRTNVGRTLLQISSVSARNGLFVPVELTLLGKTLLQLDEIGRTLHSSYDTIDAIRRHVNRILSQKMNKDFSKGSVLNTLLETKDFVTGLPGRLNRMMDVVSNNELEIRIVSSDTRMVMEGLHKIANRITTGIILAAMIIGASFLIRVDTTFRIMGYPGLALLLFFVATVGSLWLVVTILIQDRKSERKNIQP